jgi:hypothetical protein
MLQKTVTTWFIKVHNSDLKCVFMWNIVNKKYVHLYRASIFIINISILLAFVSAISMQHRMNKKKSICSTLYSVHGRDHLWPYIN